MKTKRIMHLLSIVAVVALLQFLLPVLAFSESGTTKIPMSELEVIPLDDAEIQGFKLPPITAEDIAARSSGAWSDVEVGPTLYQKGYWYGVQFAPSTYVPPGAVITLVAWQWSVGNPGQHDLIVAITNDYIYPSAYDISNYGVGTTTVFNDPQQPANQSFYLFFLAPGSGALNPAIYGQSDTITVSWTTP